MTVTRNCAQKLSCFFFKRGNSKVLYEGPPGRSEGLGLVWYKVARWLPTPLNPVIQGFGRSSNQMVCKGQEVRKLVSGLIQGANMGGIGKPHVFEVFNHGIHSPQSCYGITSPLNCHSVSVEVSLELHQGGLANFAGQRKAEAHPPLPWNQT